jgi:tRNA A-37 threonylcarbamoyl transferase component Bud32
MRVSVGLQLLDIRLVVRRGIRYLLARNVLRVAVLLPLLLLIGSVLLDPKRTIAEIVIQDATPLALATAAAVALRFRPQLSLWLDRRFFPEARRSEQVLMALSDAVRGCRSLTEVTQLVGSRIEAALRARRVLVFYREPFGKALTLGHSTDGAYRDLQLPDDSALLRALELEGKSLDVGFVDTNVGAEDGRWLHGMGAQLVVPIGGGNRKLLGMLLLGGKESGEPYTRPERRLLETVAARSRTACENTTVSEPTDLGPPDKPLVLEPTAFRDIIPLKECPACGRCYDGTEETCARDQIVLRPSVPVERTIDGKYRLERLAGQGGMGAVYEATDLRLARTVAVKVMRSRLFGARQALQRFEREARTAASLRHPNVVAVYDYGHIGAEGAYFVMEILHGVTLRQELRARGALPPTEAAVLFDQVLDALHAAHEQGIVHRDLKPENVFLARESNGDRVVKVLDFGLAKVRPHVDPMSLTLPGTIMGTRGYSSPEQLAGRAVDQRTDLFALGLIVVEAITGAHPFAAEDVAKVVTAIVHKPFRLPGDAPEVRRLDSVLQKCLAKDAEQRLRSAAEVKRALIPALRRCPPLSPGLPTHRARRG